MFYDRNVKLFDSTDIVALKLKRILDKEKLLNTELKEENKFYISDYTETFEKTAETFYGNDIHLEYYKLWK